MAILTGAIKYRGSFKSIRNYMNLHDPNTYAGEKGGANRDLILNNPAFARTRENMNEFEGSGIAVKAIRRGFLNLLPDQTDSRFTGRLMKLVKEINRRDYEGIHGKRAIMFSTDRPFLLSMVFNVLQHVAEMFQNKFVSTHTILRTDATLTLTDLNIKPVFVPKGASHFRIQHHLSIISDYTYYEANRRYEPVSNNVNGLSTFAYSEYTLVDKPLTEVLKAQFPVGTILSEDASVIECVGIEFYMKSGPDGYLPLKGSGMMVIDVF